MTAFHHLTNLRRKLHLNYSQLATELDLPRDLIKRAETTGDLTAREWHDLEESLAEYLSPARLEEHDLTQDAVDDLLEQLPFEWQQAAGREYADQR